MESWEDAITPTLYCSITPFLVVRDKRRERGFLLEFPAATLLYVRQRGETPSAALQTLELVAADRF